MTSDAKGNQKDAKQPSAEKPPEPSTPPKLFNEEQQKQVDKLLSARHSTLDKEIAGLKRTVESNKTSDTNLKTQLKTANQTAADLRKTTEEAEFAAIPRDNADALSMFTARQVHKEEVRTHEANVATFEEQKAQHAADIAEAKGFKTLQAATEIVSRDEFKGVKADDLTKLTDGSPDKMEALAKILVIANNPNPATPVDPNKPPETLPDPGSNIGGAGQLSIDQIDNMSVEDYMNHPSNKNRFKDTYEQGKGA